MARNQLDAVFDALADPHRRHVCRHISDTDETEVSLDELAVNVGRKARSGHDACAPDVDSRDDLKAHLHHVHLPKLDVAGIVEYDAGNHLVEPDAFLVVASRAVRTCEAVDTELGDRNWL